MTTHKEVARRWTSWPAGLDGRASGYAMHAYGPVIYSWGTHFPIACRAQSSAGECVLFTTRGYSPSTAKHCTITFAALASGTAFGGRVFKVDNVLASTFSEHLANVRARIADIQAEVDRTKRARRYSSLEHAQRMCVNLNAYCAAFKLNTRVAIDGGFVWSSDDHENAPFRLRSSDETVRRELKLHTFEEIFG